MGRRYLAVEAARVVRPPLRASASPVTLVYPFYENPKFLARQIEHLSYLPDDLRENLLLIVVDDGSPDEPAEPVLRAADRSRLAVRLFRIDVDVRWNWIGARNVGMHHAGPGWCVMTDIDHVIPESTLRTCVYGVLDPRIVYRFSRVEWTGEVLHPHPNSWLVDRDAFWRRLRGYDECLSGHYGTDGEFRRRVAESGDVAILADPLVRYEHVGDSSTRRYKRKQPEDAGVQAIVRARRPGWRPKVLSFPYREISL